MAEEEKVTNIKPDLTDVTDVTCPFCGNLCDDIHIKRTGDDEAEVHHACGVGYYKFKKFITKGTPRKNLLRKKSGDKKASDDTFKEAKLDACIDKAAELLIAAKKPVLFGWASTSVEAIREGIALSEEVGGIIDQTTSVCHGPSTLAVQDVGISSCTLGTVLNHADLIIYWGCNPSEAHLRHMSRYTVYPRGAFREKGRQDREVVVVDVRETSSTSVATQFIKVDPNTDYELVHALRLAMKGEELPDEIPGTGVTKKQVMKLAQRLKRSKFCAFFFGLGLTMTRGRHRNIDAILSLGAELNKDTKVVIRPMRGHYNVAGAAEVFTWQTGYPYAVDLTRGYARYNPGETSLVDLLVRDDADCLFIVASDPVAHLPKEAARRFGNLPVIVIDPHATITSKFADVYFPCAVTGVESEGTAYRMDGVPIKLKKVIDSDLPSDTEIVANILERVKKKRGGK